MFMTVDRFSLTLDNPQLTIPLNQLLTIQ